MNDRKIKKVFKGKLLFTFVGAIKPYDIYIRGNHSGLKFKHSEGTMFASRGVQYFFRSYECSILVYDTCLVIDSAEECLEAQDFISELIGMNWVEIDTDNKKLEKEMEKLYVQESRL